MTANGLSRSGLARGGWDALHLVQPDALAPPAGGFPREISVGLGRHPQFAIRPGARARGLRGHEVYNDYLDQLEFAETVGFDGLGVNEHHANAYGLMPSPTLMAAALARRTSRAALVVLGSSIALYEPPIR